MPWIVIPSDEAETGTIDSRDAATSTQDILFDPIDQMAPISPATRAPTPDDDNEFNSDDERELQEILRSPPTNVYTHKSIQRPVAISPPLSPVSEASEAAEDLSDSDPETTSRKTLSPILEDDSPVVDTDITYRKTVDTDSEENDEMPSSFTETVVNEPRSRRPTREHRLPARYRD
jgi:hypothetical protein